MPNAFDRFIDGVKVEYYSLLDTQTEDNIIRNIGNKAHACIDKGAETLIVDVTACTAWRPNRTKNMCLTAARYEFPGLNVEIYKDGILQ